MVSTLAFNYKDAWIEPFSLQFLVIKFNNLMWKNSKIAITVQKSRIINIFTCESNYPLSRDSEINVILKYW